jgi:hypothetical protein
MNIRQHSRCHYKRDYGSVPAGMNNLHTRRPAERRTPGGSPPPALTAAATTSVLGDKTAAATASGQTLRRKGSRPRRTRTSHSSLGERRSRGAGGVGDLVGRETFSGCCHLNTAPAGADRPKAHRQVLAPALAEAAPEHEHRPRGARRAGQPSGAAISARKTWTWPTRTRRDHRPDRGRNAAPWLGSGSSPSPA